MNKVKLCIVFEIITFLLLAQCNRKDETNYGLYKRMVELSQNFSPKVDVNLYPYLLRELGNDDAKTLKILINEGAVTINTIPLENGHCFTVEKNEGVKKFFIDGVIKASPKPKKGQ